MTETQTVRQRAAHAAPTSRPSTIGSAVLWVGTVAYGASTVALLAVLSRHVSQAGFTSIAALLGLAFVVSLVPAGIMLRSASLVADGRPPPALGTRSALLITAASLATAPILAYLLHVEVLAAAIVTIQMLIGIPLAVRQGAMLSRHRFEALGINLAIEGAARFALGAVAGVLFGVTGLAFGLCAGTAIALLALPEWRTDVSLQDRPRTSLTATSASLALLGLFVQLDVLIAPSVLHHGAATSYDLAAVPSKGVYLALLAIGPLIFPSVRGLPGRRLVLGAAAVALAFGTACAGALVLGRHLIADVLGRPPADPLEMGLLGLAMAMAGVTGIAISAGIARGVRHPWPPLVLGIAAMVAVWPLRPSPLQFSMVVLGSQVLTMVLSMATCMRNSNATTSEAEPMMELLAEAGDPFVAAQAAAEVPVPEPAPEPAQRTDQSTRRATVAAVILTFRRPELLQRLLASVRTGSLVPDEIIVVDNDPQPSVDPTTLPPGVQLVHAGLGINATGGRNVGWRASQAATCIFIDDDNEVDDRCIEVLARACEQQHIGLAGPVIYSGDQETIWCAGLEVSKWTGITRCMSIGKAEPPGSQATWATDSVPDMYALRREVLERVGGLDDREFPICGEEYDLAERVGALGLDRIIVRGARVRHYGNVSENPGEQFVRSTLAHGGERARLMARSRVRICRRHSPGLRRYTTLLIFVPLWFMASAVTCLRVKAPLAARVQAIRAIAAGVSEGYREGARR
jgi:GT2 family glycosyltransferase